MKSPLAIASLIAATQPRLIREDSTQLIVTNKARVPSDSDERLAAAEAKRLRKNARRAALRRGNSL